MLSGKRTKGPLVGRASGCVALGLLLCQQPLLDDRISGHDHQGAARRERRIVSLRPHFGFHFVSADGQLAFEVPLLPEEENRAILALDPPAQDVQRGSGIVVPPGFQ